MTTDQRKYLFKLRSDEICPDCDQIETHDHLIQCNQETRKKIKEQMLKELHDVNIKNKAPPEMHTTFVAGISAWMDNAPPPDLDDILPTASSQFPINLHIQGTR